MPTLIDISSATTIGDMTAGGGLAALKDGNTATAGRKEATSGYCGVVVASKIDSGQIDSADNGFDGSGLTTSITIKLFGKVSGTPSSATDGTELGSTTFTDVNSLTTKTITSSDKTTVFNSVWFTISTGVWANATEMRFYLPDPVSTIKKAAGVAYASIKKVAGVVIASVKKLSGVA